MIGRAAFALLLLAAGAPPATRVVADDAMVDGRLSGRALRWRIDPAGTAMPLVTMAAAQDAGLKPGPFGIVYGIGPIRVQGRTAVARIDVGGTRLKRRIGWTARAYAAGVDGVIGPGGLPDAAVRFVLRRPVAGERSVTLPMVDQGGLFGGWSPRYAVVTVGGEPIRIVFDPHHPRTLASAGAARRLAEAFGGTISGTTTQQEIAFAIERPVRTLSLARPFAIGPLAIATMGVRTADGGTASGIADADADAPPPDPEEVVVVARGGKRDPRRDRVSLGADVLARCSSIVFDNRAARIVLTCR